MNVRILIDINKKKPRALNSVWVVVQNEWFASISTPAFWLATLITPTILVASYFLFQWILGSNPNNASLEHLSTRNWQLILEDIQPEDLAQKAEKVNYAVLDLTGVLADDIRAYVVRNDQHQFLNKLLDKQKGTFEKFSQSILDDDITILADFAQLREMADDRDREMFVNQLLGYLPIDHDLQSLDFSRIRKHIDHTWAQYQETIKNLTPTLS